MRRILAAISMAGLLCSAFSSCGGEQKQTLDITVDPELTPTMLTHDVSTLISDSGITRYHITAPVWYVYGESKSPRWTFPEGVFMEKFNDSLKREATVECDSATYFEKRRLWRLDGNVRIKNIQNERFLTEQLFWDQRSQRVYSDSFIHIERQDRIIEGYGFNSNDRLTEYQVNRVSGIFPVSQFTPGASASRPDGNGQSPAMPSEPVQKDPVAPGVDPADTIHESRRKAASVRPRRLQRHHSTDSTGTATDNTNTN